MTNINEELTRAVQNANLEDVKVLLSAGADANFKVEFGNTLLHITRSLEITKELLNAGANPNEIGLYQEPPLHKAITSSKNLDIVTELLIHGAKVNVHSRRGNTALHHAVTQLGYNPSLIKELLKWGADVNIYNIPTSSGWSWSYCYTPLDYAVRHEKLPYAKLLIKHALLEKTYGDIKNLIDLDLYENELLPDCQYQELANYLDDCVSEVLQMKFEEIGSGLSLYDFVAYYSNKYALYGNGLYVRLSQIDFNIHYPIYNDIICEKIKDRTDSLSELSKIQFYTMANQEEKKIILDYDSTYSVSEYLTYQELLKLITAFEHTKEHGTQALGSLKNLGESDT